MDCQIKIIDRINRINDLSDFDLFFVIHFFSVPLQENVQYFFEHYNREQE